jgi:hypothetical protein
MALEFQYNGPVEGLDLDDRYREIKSLLYKHDCEVTFTKVNGETRSMPCTLRPEELPPQKINEDDTSLKVHKSTVVSVFCLDKKEWRSFRTANVTQIRVLDHKPA